jgi:DNA polymerase-4
LFGLKTLGQLVALPTPTVLRQFGFHGRWLQQLAGGKDNRPLVPGTVPETWQRYDEFDGPVSDSLVLQQQCGVMVKTLAQQLLGAGRGTHLLTLTLHLENGTDWQDRVSLVRATSDSVKLRYAILNLLGQAHITAGVVAITLQLAGLVPLGGQQLELFPSSNQSDRQFRRRLHELVVYYGADRFLYATLTNSALLLPEQRFQLDEFEL